MRSDWDVENQAVAAAVWQQLAGGYGPHGAAKLLDLGDDVGVVKSPASALVEQAMESSFHPYQELVRAVRTHVGDGATTATLLASGLVDRGLRETLNGLPRGALLDGVRLAKRQSLATLRAAAQSADVAEALANATSLDRTTVTMVVRGAMDLMSDRHLNLDQIDVRAESFDEPVWAEGIIATPQHGPLERHAPNIGVAIMDGGWTLSPKGQASYRIHSPDAFRSMADAEQAQRKAALNKLIEWNVRFAICGGSVDDDLCAMAARAGVWVWTDAPRDARRRIAVSTGANIVVDLPRLSGADVGRGDLGTFRGERVLSGPGPTATLTLPAHSAIAQQATIDEGERLLRALGAALEEPKILAGGGRWQRDVAAQLRSSAHHAPGKSSIAVRLVADVFDAMADAMLDNAGLDPLSRPPLPDVGDLAASMQLAVTSGFDLAESLLRIDARHDKKPSTPEALRGGGRRIGSPKGMPGDIPPLM